MCASKLSSSPLELWAGVECTVNRIGDKYCDQVERSGHAERIYDLDRLAKLGIRTLRYPVLWERTAPADLNHADWSWSDERLGRLRQLGIRPIVGLLHHGSGPRSTYLLDPEFPKKFAEFARAVAKRYPWVDSFTPINEPLTTARFSCLYGHWYPHLQSALQFARALLGQCRAIVMGMRAILEVNPTAELIQTEDLGKTFSTPLLAYQAEFENERRWLTFDLLCGRVQPQTPMWDYFCWLGIQEHELEWFLSNQTSPTVLGVNYYITSERFLDERLVRYPTESHGGNERHSYADVEAVRVCSEGLAGPKAIMRETWDRYRLPLAITEAHLGCTRDEQLRWFKEVWDAGVDLRAAGVDVRAVTAWSAFGAYDWNSLLTRESDFYEPGLFDVRSPSPRPTALAQLAESLATGADFDHPAFDSVGWWHKFDRFSYPPVTHRAQVATSLHGVNPRGASSRSLLITGGSGTLARAFARICERRGIAYNLFSRAELDIADPDAVDAVVDRYEPWAVINAAGYVGVDEAERQSKLCRRENFDGAVCLARKNAQRQIAFVTFSSDLVFDGKKETPYIEGDATSPLNVYGVSKADAESAVLDLLPSALVVRTSSFFGPWDQFNFIYAVLAALAEGHRFQAASDLEITPTYVPDLVNVTLDLLFDGEKGIWHLANSGPLSWADFARLVAQRAGYDSKCIEGVPNHQLRLAARRPLRSSLVSERATLLPPLEQAVDRYLNEREKSIFADTVMSGKR